MKVHSNIKIEVGHLEKTRISVIYTILSKFEQFKLRLGNPHASYNWPIQPGSKILCKKW